MAYFRTLKSGEQRLIYTAKDKAKQAERKNRYYSGKIPAHTVVNQYRLYHTEWKPNDYKFFWRFHNYDKKTMQNAIQRQRQEVIQHQRIVLASLYRERGHRNIWKRDISINSESCEAEATCSYLPYERGKLAYAQSVLRNMESAYRKFTQ